MFALKALGTVYPASGNVEFRLSTHRHWRKIAVRDEILLVDGPEIQVLASTYTTLQAKKLVKPGFVHLARHSEAVCAQVLSANGVFVTIDYLKTPTSTVWFSGWELTLFDLGIHTTYGVQQSSANSNSDNFDKI